MPTTQMKKRAPAKADNAPKPEEAKVAPTQENAETAKPEPAPSEIEVTSNDTVELDGITIEVKHDLVDLQKLNKSKLALVDKKGVAVKTAFPNWRFAWFTDEDAHDMVNIVGYEDAHKMFGDNLRAVAQPKRKREDVGRIEIGKDDNCMAAYCIPVDRHDEYLAWVQKENVKDTDELGGVAEGDFNEGLGEHGAVTAFEGSSVSSRVTEAGTARLE